MKRIYTLIAVSALCTCANAQITLLQAYHEPTMTINNNIGGGKKYDTVNVVPKSTGAGQSWDFSGMSMSTVAATGTFITIGSAPQGSMFPTATLAENLGGGNYNYFRSDTGAKTFEWVGTSGALNVVTSDARLNYKWPITYNSNWNDTYAGTMGTVAITGKYMVNCSGYGTITIPGGKMFTDVLQLMSMDSMSYQTGTLTTKIATTTYSYTSGQNRYPILWVSYKSQTDSVTKRSAGAWVNWLEAVGLTENNLDASFGIYPNPASSSFAVKFENGSASGNIQICDMQGRMLREIKITGSHVEMNIPVSDLPRGIYLVKTQLGEKMGTRKLIIE